MSNKTHWKKLHNPDYLGAWDFQPGEEKVLTIKLVGIEKVSDHNGKKEDCSVCRFTEDVKPMILNVTNSKMIAKLTGSPYIEDWNNVRIKVYTTRVKAFGEMVDAVRIKNEEIKKPELNPQSKAWEGAKKAVQSGQYTIEQVKSKYTITPENEKLLKEVKL